MVNPELRLNNPEEEVIQPIVEPDSVRKEADNLEEKFSKKTLGETYISEYQTRKANIRGTKIERGAAFRFERGQIYKGYKILRAEIRDAEKRGEDTTKKRDLLKEMRVRAKDMEKDLDEIEKQCYENVRMVEVQTEFGNFSVPVVEFDLKKKDEKETEEDKRTPYFFIPGMPTSDFHSSAAISMAMALRGNKVYVPVDLETSSVGKPENFKGMVKERGDLGIHAEVFRQTIKTLGLEKVNVMGHSFGATIALELALASDFKELEDLIVMEPLGVEEKGVRKLATQFGFNQTLLRFLPYSEQRIKVAKEKGSKSKSNMALYLEDVKIIAKRLYSPEKLSKIKPNGRFQVWFGTDSPIMNVKETERVFQESEELRQKTPDASPVEIYEVEKGEHMWPVRGALGLSKMLQAKKPESQITKVKISDLKNSAMAGILEDIK